MRCILFGEAVTPEGAVACLIGFPAAATGDAVVMAGICLDAGHMAVWTETAGMKPLAVGVEIIFDQVSINRPAVARGELRDGILPGVTLQPE